MKASKVLFNVLTVVLVFSVLTGCSAQKKNKAKAQKVNVLLQTARSYTGTPYRYGGTTRTGMDCSALLLNSYKSIGVLLPRTSTSQSRMGKRINTKELKPGDLVFFATGKRRRKVTHAGIVTEVKQGIVKFIHASSKMGVVESSLATSYYKQRFLFARRIL